MQVGICPLTVRCCSCCSTDPHCILDSLLSTRGGMSATGTLHGSRAMTLTAQCWPWWLFGAPTGPLERSPSFFSRQRYDAHAAMRCDHASRKHPMTSLLCTRLCRQPWSLCWIHYINSGTLVRYQHPVPDISDKFIYLWPKKNSSNVANWLH